MKIKKLKNTSFWWVALLCLGLDRITKAWVVANYALTVPPQTTPILPGLFHITYVTNRGAAFSLFANGSGWLRWLSLIVSVLLIGAAIWGPRLNRWQQVGYGCILGGALGNGIDRFLTGEVIDFLDLRWLQFPVFNIADIAINIGILCLLWSAWRQP